MEIPPRVVSDGKNLLLNSKTAGDEPYMLASNLPDVAVLVDKDRVKSGLYAVEEFQTDTLPKYEMVLDKTKENDHVVIALPIQL